jgi:transposase
MSQITARIPDALAAELDSAAQSLHRSRAELVRQAIEQYLDEFHDLSLAVERIRDPADPVLDWEEVRLELVDSD